MAKRRSGSTTTPNFRAEWQGGDGVSGVAAEVEGLIWWYTPAGSGGRFGEVSCAQTYVDFLQRGPAVPGVPEDVVTALDAAVRAGGYRP